MPHMRPRPSSPPPPPPPTRHLHDRCLSAHSAAAASLQKEKKLSQCTKCLCAVQHLMIDTLVAMDAVTYASTEYLLQASCTFAQIWHDATKAAVARPQIWADTCAMQHLIDTLVAMDAVTYASTEYLLQASCTFAQLAGNAADLTLEAAGAIGTFLAAHVSSLLQSAQVSLSISGLDSDADVLLQSAFG